MEQASLLGELGYVLLALQDFGYRCRNKIRFHKASREKILLAFTYIQRIYSDRYIAHAALHYQFFAKLISGR